VDFPDETCRNIVTFPSNPSPERRTSSRMHFGDRDYEIYGRYARDGCLTFADHMPSKTTRTSGVGRRETVSVGTVRETFIFYRCRLRIENTRLITRFQCALVARQRVQTTTIYCKSQPSKQCACTNMS